MSYKAAVTVLGTLGPFWLLLGTSIGLADDRVLIRFAAPSLDLPVATPVLIPVEVANVPPLGLAAFQFEVHFDPTSVIVRDPNEEFEQAGILPFAPLGGNPFCADVRGSLSCEDPTWFLTITGRDPFLGIASVDSELGFLTLAYATLGDLASPTGTGTVAFLELEIKDNAPTTLFFRNVILVQGTEPPTQFDACYEELSLNGAAPVLAGDSNCDGLVSAADLSALILNLVPDPPFSCAGADTNCDSRVDLQDLNSAPNAIFAPLECGVTPGSVDT